MLHIVQTLAIAVAFAITASGPASAADATAASDAARPATGVRVGGSKADAEFRAAQQKSGTAYRTARAACPKQPAVERATCIKAARDQLAKDRAAAAAAHRAKP
jgi:hypothetical protein